MSNINNWKFANNLELFKQKVLDPQKKKISDAEGIMHDPKYQWKDDAQKVAAGKQLEIYKAWLNFYQVHYDTGSELVRQHEGMVNELAKWYQVWRRDVSNEGRQEVELMSSQADMLNQIFSEIYTELKPLNLEIQPPSALNLK